MNCNDFIIISKNVLQIKIHVIPGSSQSSFPSGYNSWRKSLDVKVKSKAEDNKANIEVIEIIAKYFNVPSKKVRITRGQKSNEKIVAIPNLDFLIVYKKIEESLNEL